MVIKSRGNFFMLQLRHPSKGIAFICALVLSSLLAACSTSTAPSTSPSGGSSSSAASAPQQSEWDKLLEAAKKEKALTIVASIPTTSGEALANAFTAKYPEIKAEYIRLATGPALERLRTDKARGSNETDIFLEAPGEFGTLISEGLLLEHIPTVAKDLPAERTPRKPYGWTDRYLVFTLAFNSTKVPGGTIDAKNWDILTRPEYKGRIALIEPNLASSGYQFFFQLMKDMGETKFWDWLAKVKANEPKFYASNVPATESVVSGENLLAVVLELGPLAQIANGAPLVMVHPEPSPAYFGQVGIVAGAPHLNAAKVFMEWFLGTEGQTTWMNIYQVLPGNPAVKDVRAHTTKPWYAAPKRLAISKSDADFKAEVDSNAEFLKRFNTVMGIKNQ